MPLSKPHVVRFSLGLILIALVAGCGGGGNGGTPDTTTPAISNVRIILPPGFDWHGGDVTIQADVTDASGVSVVRATVTLPDSSQATVPMALAIGDTYSGTYDAPANPGSAAETYSVVVTATDTKGNTGSSPPFTFDVPAPQAPPPNP